MGYNPVKFLKICPNQRLLKKQTNLIFYKNTQSLYKIKDIKIKINEKDNEEEECLLILPDIEYEDYYINNLLNAIKYHIAKDEKSMPINKLKHKLVAMIREKLIDNDNDSFKSFFAEAFTQHKLVFGKENFDSYLENLKIIISKT
jgi:hypothetical protein